MILADLKIENISYKELSKVRKLATQEGETIHQTAADFLAENVTDAYVCSLASKN